MPSIQKGIITLLLFFTCSGPVSAQNDETARKDIFTDRLCAGLFWSLNQCGVSESRAANEQAFLEMARRVAAKQGRTLPLTLDQATRQLSKDLQDWIDEIGPACETFQNFPQSDRGQLVSIDFCVRRLRDEK